MSYVFFRQRGGTEKKAACAWVHVRGADHCRRQIAVAVTAASAYDNALAVNKKEHRVCTTTVPLPKIKCSKRTPWLFHASRQLQLDS